MCTSLIRWEEKSLFRKLLSFDEAKKILTQNFSPKPIGKERVKISEAHNRILAENIVAPMDVPPFSRSTVDGYAVRAQDTFGADENRPIPLKLCGRVNVGEAPNVTVDKGLAVEIFTGAPMPKGADAVVMFEHTIRKNITVYVHESVSKGENVMKAGSDIHKSETVLKEGERLSSQEIGVLAALGLKEVEVYKRPRVAIISTGVEVVEPGKPLQVGKIYDINTYTLSAAVLECGGEPINIGIIQDETDKMRVALEKALEVADVVVTSGGVSVGPTDIIPKVLDTLGKPGVIVYGMATKPGKPTTIAIINGKPVFSLPGHPTSSLLMFHLLVRPVIASMSGQRDAEFLTVKAVASMRMFLARGRRTFITVNLKRDESGKLVAAPVALGLSGAITTLAKADGFIEIHESRQFVDAGEEVSVLLFKPALYYSLKE